MLTFRVASSTISTAKVRQQDWLRWWDGLASTAKTRVKVTTFFVVVALAYHYSLSSLIQTVGFDTPLAYVGLVPLLAAGLAALRANPEERDSGIHDRQLDWIVGTPLIAGALVLVYWGPAHFGDMYWVYRLDLLSMPFFVAGVVALLFGCRALWRQKMSVGYLFLAWPWPYSSILLGTLGGFTDVTLAGLKTLLRAVPIAQAVPGPNNAGLFQVTYHGHVFPVSVVTACSGVDGMVGFFLVGAAFATIIKGPLLRKAIWLTTGLVLLWATNLLRLMLIFWAGAHFGEHVAIGILHPVAGLVIFCLDVGLMALLLRPFRLHMADFLRERQAEAGRVEARSSAPRRSRAAVPRFFLAAGVVSVIALLLAVNNSTLRNYDPVADAAGQPNLTSFLVAQAVPAGWSSTYDTEETINKPLFGESSLWYRYFFEESATHTPADLTATLPITADIIDAGGMSGFEQYGVTACYSFHGYELRDVANVNLGEGVTGQALSYSDGDADWSIVYWIVPVKLGTQTRYERVILYLQNTADGQITLPTGSQPVNGLSKALDTADPVDARLVRNRIFLVDFAKQMIAGQTRVSTSEVTLDDVAAEHSPTPVSSSVALMQDGQGHSLRQQILADERSGREPNGYKGIYVHAPVPVGTK